MEKNKLPIENFLPESAKNAVVLLDGAVESSIFEEGLNISAADDGLKISLAKNKTLSEPLYVVYIADKQAIKHKTKITLETSAELSIIEIFMGEVSSKASISRNVHLNDNSKLNATVINLLNGGNNLEYASFAELCTDSKLKNCNILLNDGSSVFEDITHTIGKGAEAEVSTIAISANKQKQKITTRIENLAQHSIGNIINYGIAKDTARLEFNGIGKIHKGKTGVDNQQETRILTLSKTAEAVANPFLLIDEGDITAGHAATIGQINEEQIYYLMSRGLSKSYAQKIIAQGFLTPFIDNFIDNPNLKEQLLLIIGQKLD